MIEETLPLAAHIPGGPFPRPADTAHPTEDASILRDGHWRESASYLRGFALFNDGFYWEAHEIWELLWNQQGRVGPIADLLRGLIKLAAAGVKVRQKQRHGVVTHGARAAVCFENAKAASSATLLGMDLDRLAGIARKLATNPATSDETLESPRVIVFPFRLTPGA